MFVTEISIHPNFFFFISFAPPSNRYVKPLESFEVGVHSEDIFEVDIMGKGQSALEETNKVLGMCQPNPLT